MEKEAAEADEPETEARRKALEEEEALLKVMPSPSHAVHQHSCMHLTFASVTMSASQIRSEAAAGLDRDSCISY